MKSAKFIGIIGMLAGLCSIGHAAILAPGGVGLDAPQAPGPAPLETLITPFDSGFGLTGTTTSWVVEDPANPLGGLSFYYQVSDTGVDGIGRFVANDFGIVPGTLVDVSTITAPFDSSVTGGVSPTTATRSSGAGSTVGFFFQDNEVNPQQSSVVMVINTAYQGFQLTSGSVIDGSGANMPILGPSLAPIPEPSTYVAASLLLTVGDQCAPYPA